MSTFVPPGYRLFTDACKALDERTLHAKLAVGEIEAFRWDRLNGTIKPVERKVWLKDSANIWFRHFYKRDFDRAVYEFRRLLNSETVLIKDNGAILSEETTPEEPDQSTKPCKTGAPGRPSSMHLIVAEFQRRKNAGKLAEPLQAEADTLAAWLRETHPNAPQPTTSTICNNIRDDYPARLKATPKKAH